MKYSNLDNSYVIVIVSPYHNLKIEWVENLRQRWLADKKNEKNRIAYKDAEENFQNENDWLASQNEFSYFPIKSMDYLFSNIVEGLCCIYGIDRYCHSKIHRHQDYNEDED